jgi:hypothetical protein
MALYNFTPKRLPGPGTGNFAFEPGFSLPAQVAGGPGTSYRRGFKPLAPPQSYFGQQQTIIGLEGIPAGSIVGQGLIEWDKYLAAQNPGN